jgi:Kef-type K+ transport system membrane component KefB
MEPALFFLQIGLMLSVALLFGQAMRRVHQPAVVGELLGGILIGPTVLGFIAPGLFDWLFPGVGISAISRESLIQIGLLFFLFVAGLEVNLSEILRSGKRVLLIGLLGVAVPFGLGFGLALGWPELIGKTSHGRALLLAVFLGTALSISALPIIARILIELGLHRHEFGSIVMLSATINDLIGWSLFAIILGQLEPPQFAPGALWLKLLLTLGFGIGIILIGHRVSHPALFWIRSRLPWPSGLIGVTSVLILVASAACSGIGIEPIFGAFLVGIALGRGREQENHAYQVVHHFAMSFFAPLYFVSIGLKADYLREFDFLLVAVLLATACVGKILGAALGARLGGMNTRNALSIGFAMNARGAMEMILASVAYERQLIDERLFVALIVVAVVTSVISGPVLSHYARRVRAEGSSQSPGV